ncbi:MAG: helix-turn-helix domain-containing protein [Xanthomonadales bacterium]|nr:helix-turn-helix domain-containing protein [Xanthomonadales bacterium]
MSQLSDLLTAARKTRGLSLQKAADLIGCTKGYLWELEKGSQSNPTLKMIVSMTTIYGLRPSAIVAAYEPETSSEGGDA